MKYRTMTTRRCLAVSLLTLLTACDAETEADAEEEARKVGVAAAQEYAASLPKGPQPAPEPLAGTVDGQRAAVVEGELDSGLIRRIVRAHINEVRFCYNEGLTRKPELAGEVSAKFTISEEGKVAEPVAVTGTLGDEAVERCIGAAIQRWIFPKPQNGEVAVTYPFVLSPG